MFSEDCAGALKCFSGACTAKLDDHEPCGGDVADVAIRDAMCRSGECTQTRFLKDYYCEPKKGFREGFPCAYDDDCSTKLCLSDHVS